MDRMRWSAKYFLAGLICGVGLLFAAGAQAQPDLRMGGNISYSHTATTAIMAVDRIDNLSIDRGISVDARLELWAFRTPYTGINQVGYEQAGFLMATYDLGPLAFGYYFANVNSGSVPFKRPPAGTWFFTLMLTESNGGNHNAFGFLPRDFRNFPSENFALIVAQSASPPDPTPQPGLWWNPDESGSGYALDFKHGTLVVTVYSYKANGDPQWYVASGPLNGTTFTATLDKYLAGQCISCAYAGNAVAAGNDGLIAIEFASSTSATVKLPGGRVTKIQPQAF